MKKITIFLLLALLTVFFVSCKTTPVSQLSQDEGISRIRESYKERQWTEVIHSVDEYRIRYPYSQYSPEADLMQADAFYQADRFPEAIAAYEDFIRKNPKNENAALASFRIARSYDFQDPSAYDREQLNAQKAIAKYNYYIKTYPATEWIKDATDRIEALNHRLANYNQFIADFYWRKDLYSSALSRYLNILENYPKYADLKKEALERGAICYNELARELEQNPDSDKSVYFIGEQPQDLRKKAEDLKNQYK